MHREGNCRPLCSASARTRPGTAPCRTGTETAGWWRYADQLVGRGPCQGPGRRPPSRDQAPLAGPDLPPQEPPLPQPGPCAASPPRPTPTPELQPWPGTPDSPIPIQSSPPLPCSGEALLWVPAGRLIVSCLCFPVTPPVTATRHHQSAAPRARLGGAIFGVTQGGRLGGYQPFPTHRERSRGRDGTCPSAPKSTSRPGPSVSGPRCSA